MPYDPKTRLITPGREAAADLNPQPAEAVTDPAAVALAAGMTPAQRTAYLHPCRIAAQTVDQRFHQAGQVAGRAYSVTLTANIGLE